MNRKKNHVIPALGSQIQAWTAAAERFKRWHSENAPKAGPPGRLSEWTRIALNAAVIGKLQVNFTDRETIPRGPRGPRGSEGRTNDEPVIPHQFRATQGEINSWTSAADAEGLERAEWCRQVLNAAAENDALALALRGAA